MENLLINPEGNLLNYTSAEIVLNITIALFIGLVLSMIYRYTHKGISYSQSFNHTLVFVTVIVAIIMMVIGGSLARAFALVGALSIIRFRTVLKDTKDLSYIFAALTLGMAAGTSNYFLSAVGTFVIPMLSYIFHVTNFGAMYKSEFILRFRFNKNENSDAYLVLINQLCKSSNLLHIEPSGDNNSMLLTYDISLKDDKKAGDLTGSIAAVKGVSEAILIASKNDIDY